MAEYASGSIHFSGLGSDVDFTDMIDKLYTIESRHAQQLLRWKADWDERRKGFEELRKELVSFRSALGNINSIDKFLVKNAHTTNASIVSATPKANAIEGSYRVEVNRLATAATWSLDTPITDKNTSLNDNDAPGEFAFTYKGKSHSIAIPKGTTLEGLRNLINNNSAQTGVKASLIQSSNGIVFQLRGMDTGKNAQLSIDKADGMSGFSYASPLTWDTLPTSIGNAYLVNKPFSSHTTSINESGSDQTFEYTHDGATHTITIADGDSLLDMANKINTATPGAAEIYQVDDKFYLQMRPAYTPRPIDDVSADLTALQGVPKNATDNVALGTYEFTINKGLSSEKTATVNVTGPMSLTELANQLNTQIPGSAQLKSEAGGLVSLQMTNQSLEEATPTANGTFGLLDWRVTRAQDSQVRINGWPSDGRWLETSTNTIDDVIEGISFNIRAEGDAIVTVSVNTDEIIKNVQKFVDSVNSLRKTITNLTKLDETKNTLDPKYAQSLFEMQKGSILTGNYGVQLISSRIKQAVAGQGIGFVHAQKSADDTIFGDMYSSLSQIGIMTNVNEGSPNYGLLEFFKENDKNRTGIVSLETALKKNPAAVAELFSADDVPFTQSIHFGYNSHIPTITKPGEYDVEYTILADGSIDPDTATINGKKATVDNVNKQIGLSSSVQPPNAADGLYLNIFDLDPTQNNPKKGTFCIKEGKINELIGLLDGEEGILGPTNGHLAILDRNYKEVMDNISKKIKLEDDRLNKWTRTTRNRFARLEGLLAAYEAKNSSLKEQLKQLGGNK